MHRRQALIADYLRAHDPVGPVASAPAAPAARHAEPRRARLVGVIAGFAAATAFAVFAVVGVESGGISGAITAEEAAAAAADDLQADGVLEWRTRSISPDEADPDRHATTTVYWTDLATGAQHYETEEFPYRAKGKLVDDRFYAWRTPDADWSARAPKDATDPIDVTEYERGFLGVGLFGTTTSPLAYIRGALDLAAQGKAELVGAAPVEGVPVVRVTARIPRQDPAGAPAAQYLKLWITKEDAPRLLRTEIESRCPSGTACDAEPEDGQDHVERWFQTETLTWTVHRRTAEALAHVAVPKNDPRFRLVPRER